MPEPLLAILKLCALALLYLFFFRVLRAVWAELSPARLATAPAAAPARAPKPTRRPRAKRGAGSQLLVLEPKEHKGRTYDLTEEVTLGRAASCTVPLDDGYVSQLHARVFPRDGGWMVEDLGSTNGTYLNGSKVTRAQPVKRGDRVKIGATVFEVDL